MEKVTSLIDTIRGYAEIGGYSVAALCVILLAIMIMTGGTQGLSKGKSWAVGIVIGVMLLSVGVGLVGTLAGR